MRLLSLSRRPSPRPRTSSSLFFSGRADCNARVTLVSLVPNRNTETRLRASVMAWEEVQEQAGIFAHRSRDIAKCHDRRRLLDPAELSEDRRCRRRCERLLRSVRRLIELQAPVHRAGTCWRWRASLPRFRLCPSAQSPPSASTSLSETDSFSSCSWACGDNSLRTVAPSLPGRVAKPAAASSWRDPASAPSSAWDFHSSAARKNSSKACAKISACS